MLANWHAVTSSCPARNLLYFWRRPVEAPCPDGLPVAVPRRWTGWSLLATAAIRWLPPRSTGFLQGSLTATVESFPGFCDPMVTTTFARAVVRLRTVCMAPLLVYRCTWKFPVNLQPLPHLVSPPPDSYRRRGRARTRFSYTYEAEIQMPR